jgi:flagellar biosynthetic protein FliR
MEAAILSFSLILARVGTFVGVLPILGGRNTPRVVKTGLALALSVMYFVNLGTGPAAKAFPQGTVLNWATFVIMLGREAVLGAFLGFAMNLLLVPVRVAGEFLGQQMGLALAPLTNPLADNPSVVVTQTLEVLATLLFLSLDGHHLFFAVLHGTLARLPVGAPLGPIPMADLVTSVSYSQTWGMMLAAPMAAALFLTAIVLALMTRAAPQLNVYSVGIGLQVFMGLFGLLVFLPDTLRTVMGLFGLFGQLLNRLV